MISVTLGKHDVTRRVTGLQWSTTDPGGFETCTFTITDAQAGDFIGDTVVVREGMEIVFMGRVNEPGSDYAHSLAQQQYTAVGSRATLSDNQASMIFIDRALGSWTGVSRQREVDLDTSWVVTPPNTQTDTTTGSPGIKLDTASAVKGTSGVLCESFYDAGLGNLVHQLIFQTDTSVTTSTFQVIGTSDDRATVGNTTILASTVAAVAEALYTLASDRRFLLLQAINSAVSTTPRFRIVNKIAVIGPHGLTLQGAGTARGYYPGDVARWATTQVGGLGIVIGSDPNLYIVPHLIYKTPVTYEQMVTDMANILGWHWGVWEPSNPFSYPLQPTLWFTPPPTTATASVSIDKLVELNLTQQFSEMYNQVRVHFTDVAGVSAYVTVTRSIPRLGTLTRTTDVDLGVSSSAVATQFGSDFLALLEASGRAVGSCKLPPTIKGVGGRVIPAHLLKPGRDRLKLIGIHDTTNSVLESDTRRFDTFRMSRLSATLTANGAVETSVELDGGANLLDVLNARLAIATQLSGV